MKKNHYIKYLFVVTSVLFGMTACQQDAIFENVIDKTNSSLSSRAGTIKCEITTTKPGQLDSLLTVKAKEQDFLKTTVEELTISGPINKKDMDVIRSYKYLKKMDLTNSQFYDRVYQDYYYTDKYESADGIPSYMFESFSCSEILLPDGISYIGDYAFWNSKITSISIPESVTTIESGAFASCKKLQTTVKLPSQLKEISSDLFSSCTAITEITIPDGVAKIASNAFDYSGLTDVHIPASVIEIGNSAFRRSNLTHIAIPATVESLGGSIFDSCKALEIVDWPDNLHVIPDNMFSYCEKLKFDIPDHITRIGDWAFQYCTNLTDVIIPKSVEVIGRSAFAESGITSIAIPATVTWSLGVFNGCEQLKTVTFSDNAIAVPEEMFRYCTNLTNVTLPSKLRKIESGAFQHCSALQQIILPNGLETIGHSAFEGCTALKQLDLPDGVKEIGSSAFVDTGLYSLTIPASVTNCGSGIVYGCNFTSIFWNTAIDIPGLCIKSATFYNDYLLIYASENAVSSESNKNVIRGSHIEKLTLPTGSRPFYSPQTFTTDEVSYTMDFGSYEMVPGESSNWKTIVLPFTVTSITQKSTGKVLAPFGADVEGAYPFWLRELTADGFVNATKIEANKPYIISMPNNSSYQAEYNIKGEVVFSASGNVEIPATPELVPTAGPLYSIIPSYSMIEKSAQVWTLNENQFYENGKLHRVGSVFLPNQRTVKPFEAYVTAPNTTRGFLPITTKAATRSAHVVGPIPTIDDM